MFCTNTESKPSKVGGAPEEVIVEVLLVELGAILGWVMVDMVMARVASFLGLKDGWATEAFMVLARDFLENDNEKVRSDFPVLGSAGFLVKENALRSFWPNETLAGGAVGIVDLAGLGIG